jgi:hypothetical protein
MRRTTNVPCYAHTIAGPQRVTADSAFRVPVVDIPRLRSDCFQASEPLEAWPVETQPHNSVSSLFGRHEKLLS